MLAKSMKKEDYSSANPTESLLRLRNHKKMSALARLSPEAREFILSSDVP